MHINYCNDNLLSCVLGLFVLSYLLFVLASLELLVFLLASVVSWLLSDSELLITERDLYVLHWSRDSPQLSEPVIELLVIFFHGWYLVNPS